MKSSFYNFELEDGSNYLLYNSLTDSLAVLNTDLKKLWLEFKDGKIKDLQSVHETLYEHLQHKGFIVPDEDDEVLRVIEIKMRIFNHMPTR